MIDGLRSAIGQIEEFICETIDEMIEKSKEQLTNHPEQPTLPLIRLRILFSDESQKFKYFVGMVHRNERFAGKVDYQINLFLVDIWCN
jgi:hypothetical protein